MYNDIASMEQLLKKTVPVFVNDQALTKAKAMKRINNGIFLIEDYIEEMIKAMLTNIVPWSKIRPHFANGDIPQIFFNYDPNILIKTDPYVFVNKIKQIKCGNISIISQMKGLKDNIGILQKLCNAGGGTIDDYFKKTLKKYPVIDYSELKDLMSNYKLKGMGVPLTCEYLKNLGFDLPKPDRHLKRFFGNGIMRLSKKKIATDKEVFQIVDDLSKKTGRTRQEIDLIIWAYCADGYGEICTIKPKCDKCVCTTCPNH